MIIVPPILRAINSNADQMERKSSELPLDPITAKDITISAAVIANIEYHHPAMSFRVDPPHREPANKVVYRDMMEPILVLVVLWSSSCRCCFCDCDCCRLSIDLLDFYRLGNYSEELDVWIGSESWRSNLSLAGD
mmetsp:Transcript_12515/g.34494  ORF Transcript_12515/g.34494 Transcript_12515/m.34494 type:complete len:135 (+) Transcript_12515:1135-1539(+)